MEQSCLYITIAVFIFPFLLEGFFFMMGIPRITLFEEFWEEKSKFVGVPLPEGSLSSTDSNLPEYKSRDYFDFCGFSIKNSRWLFIGSETTLSSPTMKLYKSNGEKVGEYKGRFWQRNSSATYPLMVSGSFIPNKPDKTIYTLRVNEDIGIVVLHNQENEPEFTYKFTLDSDVEGLQIYKNMLDVKETYYLLCEFFTSRFSKKMMFELYQDKDGKRKLKFVKKFPFPIPTA